MRVRVWTLRSAQYLAHALRDRLSLLRCQAPSSTCGRGSVRVRWLGRRRLLGLGGCSHGRRPGRDQTGWCPRLFGAWCLDRLRFVQDGQGSAEGALVPALFSYAAQEFGDEFFEEAWDEFFLWTDAPGDIESSNYSQKSVIDRSAFEPDIVSLKQKLGLG